MRPKYEKIKQECEQIKALWAKGYDDAQVRRALGMANSIYETRLKYIARDRFDTNKEFTLLQYQMKKQRRYDQLEAMLKTVKSDEMKLKCIQEMNILDDDFVKMGQSLGIFHTAPQKVAGVFAGVGISADTDIEHIRREFKDIVIENTKKMIRERYTKKKKKRKRNEDSLT